MDVYYYDIGEAYEYLQYAYKPYQIVPSTAADIGRGQRVCTWKDLD